MRKIPHLPGSSRAAFTLIELLVVIAIIAMIASFSMPAVSTVLRGSQLTQSSQMVGDQLNLARQAALTRNHSVEVRFYQFGDPTVPGEKVATPTSGKYRALQIFEIQESGSAVALGKIQHIPASIIIDSGTTLSTLLGSAKASPATPTLSDGATLKVSLPRVGTNYNSISFQFRPGGSTNLSIGSSWFFTLHNLSDGDALTVPAANFFCINIDPSNGHIQTYRP